MSDDGPEENPVQETTMANGGRKPLLNRIFAALSHRRRRYVLYYLRDHGQASLDNLAIQVAAWEQDLSIHEVATEDVDQVLTSLRHSHLLKLEDYGLVEYDRRTNTVSYTHPPSSLEEALKLTAALEKQQ